MLTPNGPLQVITYKLGNPCNVNALMQLFFSWAYLNVCVLVSNAFLVHSVHSNIIQSLLGMNVIDQKVFTKIQQCSQWQYLVISGHSDDPKYAYRNYLLDCHKNENAKGLKFLPNPGTSGELGLCNTASNPIILLGTHSYRNNPKYERVFIYNCI